MQFSGKVSQPIPRSSGPTSPTNHVNGTSNQANSKEASPSKSRGFFGFHFRGKASPRDSGPSSVPDNKAKDEQANGRAEEEEEEKERLNQAMAASASAQDYDNDHSSSDSDDNSKMKLKEDERKNAIQVRWVNDENGESGDSKWIQIDDKKGPTQGRIPLSAVRRKFPGVSGNCRLYKEEPGRKVEQKFDAKTQSFRPNGKWQTKRMVYCLESL